MKTKFLALGLAAVVALGAGGFYAGALTTTTGAEVGAGAVEVQSSCASAAVISPGKASWDGASAKFRYATLDVSFTVNDGQTCEGQKVSANVFAVADGSEFSKNASPHKITEAENTAAAFSMTLDTSVPADIVNQDYRYGLVFQGTTPPTEAVGVSGTPGNQQVTLVWNTPTSDGGAAIVDYVVQYSTNGTTWATFDDGVSVATSATVTGLTNGTLIPPANTSYTSYVFRVKAVNDSGKSVASAPSAPVTPRQQPNRPTGVTATNPAGGAAAVSWSAPSWDGGAPVTGYTVTADPGGGTCATAGALTCTVTGLSHRAYTFTVTASNVGGASASSNASASLTVNTASDAPTALTGTAGDQQIALSWTAPVSDGGLSITDYHVYYLSHGIWTLFDDGVSTSTSATLTGLTNGTGYQFYVLAINDYGSAWSALSASVTPRTTPGAPTGVSGTAGAASVSLTWTAPASNGGATVTDYQVQYSSDGTNWTTFNDGVSAGLSATVTGLTNGTAYTFRVAATNAAGTGTASSASSSVTPRTTPGAPTGVSATAGITQASVSWTAPASSGGSAITGYTVTSSPGGKTCTTAGTVTCTVTGLTAGVGYTFTVTATNAAGTGSASGASSSVTPTSAVPAGTVTATVALSGAEGITFNPAGTRAYSIDSGGNMKIIDVATGAVISTVSLGAAPRGVVIDPAGAFAYTANFAASTLSKIDLATNAVSTISVPGGPFSMAIDPTGTYAYTANNSAGTVSKIALSTGTVVGSAAVGAGPISVAIDPTGTYAYTANNSAGTVSKVRLSDNTVTGSYTVGSGPRSIVVDPAGAFALVTDYQGNTASKINLSTGAVTTFTLGSGLLLNSLAINPAGTYAFVTDTSNSMRVLQIDTSTGAVFRTMSVDGYPNGISISPDGTTAYVTTNRSASAIYVGP